MRKKIIAGSLISTLLLASSAVFARDPIEMKQKIYKIEMQNNKEVKYETDKVYPGDTIEYQINLSNTTEKELTPTVTRSLPDKVEFIAGSDSPKAEYSLDGKTFLGEDVKDAEEVDEDEDINKPKKAPVKKETVIEAKDYKAIKFTVKLAPKQQGTIIYRIKTKQL